MSRCDHARLLVRAKCQEVGEEEVVQTDGKDFKEGKERMKEVKERMKWTPIMDEMLVVQILAQGVSAFVRGTKANTKDMTEEEKWNRDTAWLNEEDGIMTTLWGDANFSKFKQPKYESVLQHVKNINI